MPGLREWQQALSRCVPETTRTYLVAGRIDVGLRFDREKVRAFARQHGYEYFETSANDGRGCQELRRAIEAGIPWNQLERRTSPATWKMLNDEILKLRDEGQVLFTFKELRETLRQRVPAEARFTDTELETVVGLLDGPGVVKELSFGTYILLRPEWMNAYAQAVIRTLRADEKSLGCLPVQSIAQGKLIFQTQQSSGEVVEEQRLGAREEPIVLHAMEEALLERRLCLRQEGNLVFPSYCGVEKPAGPVPPKYFIRYVFGGFLDDVYATLVATLVYCGAFKLKELWRDAADFETLTERGAMGIKLLRNEDGRGTLLVHFSAGVREPERVIFANYIHEHLQERATEPQRLRFHVCPHCDSPVKDSELARQRLEERGEEAYILCQNCEKRIPLWDSLEKRFASEAVKKRVLLLRSQERIELDSRRKIKLLALEVAARITSAGQRCFEIPGVEDEGLDMEVEFTDGEGRGTGRRIYLQLKAGNSHLTRQKDGAEIFRIKKQSWVKYWLRQDRPVLLVVGTFPEESEELRGGGKERFAEIRWMEIGEVLRRESVGGTRAVSKIVFQGERLDTMAVRGWRDAQWRGAEQSRELLARDAAHNPDASLRLSSIERLTTFWGDTITREFLFRRGANDSDETVRGVAVKKLAAMWPDDRTRDFLLDIAEKDTSVEVRALCFETLSNLWWNELAVRLWLRSRAMTESVGDVRQRLIRTVEGAGRQVSGLWEAKLSGQGDAEKEPETMPGYPAFRVSRFRLRDIGPFHDTREVVLRPDVNVFLGDNAAGKTTILRCLGLAAIGLAGANEVEDNASGYLRKGADRGSIEVLFELTPDPDSLPGEVGYFAVGLQIVTGSLRFSPIPKDDLAIKRPNRPAASLVNSAEHLGALRSVGLTQFGFVSGYGAVRTFSVGSAAHQAELKKPENEWVRSLFKPDTWLVSPEVFTELVRGDASDLEGPPSSALPPALVETLRGALKHLVSEAETFFSESDNDLRLNRTDLRFGELSDGYRSLLALMGHLLRCSLKVRNWKDDPTQIGGIALIDEMDLHLHPAWQSHVVGDFHRAFPNIQLIASTHSPLVIAALRREAVLIMRCEEDGSTTVDHPELDPQGARRRWHTFQHV